MGTEKTLADANTKCPGRDLVDGLSEVQMCEIRLKRARAKAFLPAPMDVRAWHYFFVFQDARWRILELDGNIAIANSG